LRPRVQAGNYEIPPHASPEEIIALFEQGKVVLEQLTVVEGATFDDFLAALDQHPHVLHTLRGKSPAAIMGALGHPGVSPEGEFFPDTYRFAANTPDIAILTLAYDSMQRVLADAWTERRPGLPPTPVALPGRESVLAAVRPEETQALYFVATGLGDGAHHFSRTLEEHNSAVKAYLARLRTQEHAADPKPVSRRP